MSEYTAVSFGAMSTGAADYASVYQSLNSTLQTLQGELQSTLSTWTGEAQSAYYAAKAKWDAAAADMATVVNSLSNVVSTAGENYVTTEQRNTQMWT